MINNNRLAYSGRRRSQLLRQNQQTNQPSLQNIPDTQAPSSTLHPIPSTSTSSGPAYNHNASMYEILPRSFSNRASRGTIGQHTNHTNSSTSLSHVLSITTPDSIFFTLMSLFCNNVDPMEILELQKWINSSPDNERSSREQVIEMIAKYRAANNSDLQLSFRDFGLTELPSNLPILFPQLRKLDVSNNPGINLPDSYGDFLELTSLTINNCDFKNLPEWLGNFGSLEILSAHHNKLSELPESFINLKKLTRVDLSDNRLTKLPENFTQFQAPAQGARWYLQAAWKGVKSGIYRTLDYWNQGNYETGLKRLEYINLSDNPLQVLPSTFFDDLPHLKALNIRGTQLNLHLGIDAEFAALNQDDDVFFDAQGYLGFQLLQNMENWINEGPPHERESRQLAIKLINNYSNNELDLSSLGISQLPHHLSLFLPGLEKLDISNNPGLANLPDSYAKFHSLRELKINNCGLESLPKWIEVLDNLKCLSATHNRLTEIPDNIVKLNITELDLSHNQLASLPETNYSPSLTRINIENNRLTMLPEGLHRAFHLQSLNISSNSLSEFPKFYHNMTNLTDLNLSHNRIWSIDENFFQQVTSLEKLDLSNNDLDELPTFPNFWMGPDFNGFLNLHSLKASHNSLEQLPSGFSRLTGLKDLDLHNNNISCIPYNLPPNLKNLNLENNQILFISDSVFEQFSKTNTTIALTVSPKIREYLTEKYLTNGPSFSFHTIDDTSIDVGSYNGSPLQMQIDGEYVYIESPDLSSNTIPQIPGYTSPYSNSISDELMINTPISRSSSNGENSMDVSLNSGINMWALLSRSDPSLFRNWEKFEHEVGADSFGTVLFRLADTADVAIGGESRMSDRVDNVLHAIKHDSKLRNTCFEISVEALSDCSDRAAWAFQNIEIAVQTHQIEQKSGPRVGPEMLEFAKQHFRLREVEKIAYKHADKHPGTEDESVEILLAFQTELQKKGVSLPINTNEMAHLDITAVHSSHIRAAHKKIDKKEGGNEMIDFIAKFEPWKNFLQRTAPYNAQFESINNEFCERLEKLTNECTDSKTFIELSKHIQEQQEAAVVNLCKEITRHELIEDQSAKNHKNWKTRWLDYLNLTKR